VCVSWCVVGVKKEGGRWLCGRAGLVASNVGGQALQAERGSFDVMSRRLAESDATRFALIRPA